LSKEIGCTDAVAGFDPRRHLIQLAHVIGTKELVSRLIDTQETTPLPEIPQYADVLWRVPCPD
jgi:hypothetical protein